ncbi:hypothetical protein EDB85DRAFT_195759 [Lactarius pseudohatsudake]|nr:hypothetical protein EDB85DRAFT_195759 [Lactarius pseudohatsudake]
MPLRCLILRCVLSMFSSMVPFATAFARVTIPFDRTFETNIRTNTFLRSVPSFLAQRSDHRRVSDHSQRDVLGHEDDHVVSEVVNHVKFVCVKILANRYDGPALLGPYCTRPLL